MNNTDTSNLPIVPGRKSPSISVLCHLFYPSTIYHFLERLAPLKSYNAHFIFNLSLSLSRDDHFMGILSASFPEAIILQCPDKGRDIGGKMAAIGVLLQLGATTDYSLIIHDKLSPHAHTGLAWRDILLKVTDADQLPGIFKIFEKDQGTGVITASEFVKNDYDPDKNSFTNTSRENIISYIKSYGLQLSNYNFAAGTIFWIRTGILKTFFDQFPPWGIREGLESGNALDFLQGTNIHAWERLFSFIASAQGFTVIGI